MLTLLTLNSITAFLVLTFGSIFALMTGESGAVTQLPFGLDYGFVIFMRTINGAMASMPWIETPLTLIFIAIHVKVILVTVDLTRWIIGLVRG